MTDGDDRVELTDLDVIARYSLAVRTATAARAELVETLRSDLEWLESLGRPTRSAPARLSDAAPPAPPAKRVAAKKAAAKKAAGRRR
jgi:hypothetical protein